MKGGNYKMYQSILSLYYSCSLNALFVFRFHLQIRGQLPECLRMSSTQRVEGENISSEDGVSCVTH
jgi:hypothetical protein